MNLGLLGYDVLTKTVSATDDMSIAGVSLLSRISNAVSFQADHESRLSTLEVSVAAYDYAITTGLPAAIAGRALAIHTHVIADVTGLQAALDGKSAVGHTHALGDVVGLNTALAGKSAVGHTHAMTDVVGLVAALTNKSNVGHTHAFADLTGTPTTLAGFGLLTEADGRYAALLHTHAVADVTGLQDALDAKLDLTGGTLTGALSMGAAGAGYNGLWMRAAFVVTGNAVGTGINIQPTFGSDVTSPKAIYAQLRTQAAAYTVAAAYGLQIDSPSVGAGSDITTAYGLYVVAQAAATTNYAIYTNAGLVRLGGQLLLGTISTPTRFNIWSGLTTSGNAAQYGLFMSPTVGADATTSATGGYFRVTTAAASFVVTNMYGLYVSSPTFGAGSSVATQYGLYLENVNNGSTASYAIWTGSGTVSLGANLTVRAGGITVTTGGITVTAGLATFSAGISTTTVTTTAGANIGTFVGIGTAGSIGQGLYVNTTLGTNTSQYGALIDSLVSSAATVGAVGLYVRMRTAAAVFTAASGYGIQIATPTLGAGSIVTTLYGLFVATQAGGGTNYAIYTNTGLVSLGDAVTIRTGGLAVSAGAVVLAAGDLTVGASALAGAAVLTLQAAAGQARQIGFRSAGLVRWAVGVTATAEAGSNAGSNFSIDAKTDAGGSIDSPISIVRAAGGAITMVRLLSLGAGLTVTAGAVTLPAASLSDAALSANVVLRGAPGALSGLLSLGAGLTVTAGAITLPAASIADAALSVNIGRLGTAQTFTALKTFSAGLTVSAGAITLPAASVADAALSANVALLSTPGIQTWTGRQYFNAGDTTLFGPFGLYSEGDVTIDGVLYASGGLVVADLTADAVKTTSIQQAKTALSYAASFTLFATDGVVEITDASSGSAFTINAPLSPLEGQVMEIRIKNTSGGALGAATWNAVFKMAAWVNPANGFSRTITFRYDGTYWVERSRTPADVPN